MLAEGADGDGDGYPAEKTTLLIDCRIEIDLEVLFEFQLEGSLVLLDEDDMDSASGFESKLEYEVWVTIDEETLMVGGTRDMRARVMEDGSGYAVAYEGEEVLNDPQQEFQSRLKYTGTVKGTFESGMLAIGGGRIVFASSPIDCTVLGDAEREACEEQAQENPGPPVAELAVQTPPARLRYGGL